MHRHFKLVERGGGQVGFPRERSIVVHHSKFSKQGDRCAGQAAACAQGASRTAADTQRGGCVLQRGA